MRPPMQTKALQQHENTRHLPQQQTTQYQINQFQEEANVAFSQNINATAPLLAATAETKAQQKHLHEAKVKSSKDLFVENKLLKHKQFALVLGQQEAIPTNDSLITTGNSVGPRALSPIGIHTCQPKEQQLKHQKQHLNFLNEDSESIQLVDVKENLPNQQTPNGDSPFATTTTTAIITTRPHSYINSSNNSIQRNSLSSQYSRSSSSSDEPSSCSLSYSSRANTFDDAAEHFIINFPSDSATHAQPHPPYYLDENSSNSLPLSETEPLLTNIEATVNDSKRSICLTKNSASLVFTKKDLLSKLPVTSANNNSKHLLAKQTPASQTTKSSQSFRLANENSSNKRTKHLPPTYHRHLYQAHQQHRRSLQLNYNNNLVTTTTCCNSNNNYCCNNGIGTTTGKNNTSVPKRRLGVSGPVVGTLTYNKTAAITRKQHAYSWYAPVYSALEEELEQDSRDSSPIHNLANSKQKSSHNQHYQHKNNYNSGTNVGTENESVALIESRNQAKIQTISSISNQGTGGSVGGSIGSVGGGIGSVVGGKRDSIISQNQTGRRKSSNTSGGNQGANSLIFPTKNHYNGTNNPRGNYNSEIQGLSANIEEGNGLQASSLGLAGGPLPTRKRFGNFLKSLVGLRSASTSSSSSSNTSISNTNTNGNGATNINTSTTTTRNNGSPNQTRVVPPPLQIPRQQPPKTLAIQRPLSPEITITRTPSEQNMVVLRDPRGYNDRERHFRQNKDKFGFVSSKEGSTSSLNVVQQKIWNIVRREQSANSLLQEKSQSIVQYTAGLRKCETVLALTRQGASQSMFNNDFDSKRSSNSNVYTGSGIFSPNGIEQIRPLNRLRPSIQATCSRCSSLLSLAASGSRSSLSSSFHQGLANSTSHLHLQYIQPKVGSSQGKEKSTSSLFNSSYQKRLERLEKQNEKEEDNCSNISLNTASVPLKTIPQLNCNKSIGSLDSLNKSVLPSRKQMQSDEHHHQKPSFNSSHSMPATELNSPSSPFEMAKSDSSMNLEGSNKSCLNRKTGSTDYELDMSNSMFTFLTPSASQTNSSDSLDGNAKQNSQPTTDSNNSNVLQHQVEEIPFETFTCKLCLVDVEDGNEATKLQQCGCCFCTECMKAYVEYEISEAAYEISCPDAQCPTQGVMTLAEISDLTTTNLMKKHHGYRLNREIELDKTRTWCPRAGCETVCNVGIGPHSNDATPSTSTFNKTKSGSSSSSSPTAVTTFTTGTNKEKTVTWAVQCPTCKDEFCSACKKSWHPNISCEEHGRRLVADGQDDIGIPFDNDLIKCCPMCAVPIEKDEGCAQMMCKRCKHVFCWYCLASLDDDFLLRHYDKGPCKNKLGHSRASVVWHRAQVIGIFAGFGILLLVASPLLLLAAPCIICCKCRSCSGSKIDDGEDELDEATALQSS